METPAGLKPATSLAMLVLLCSNKDFTNTLVSFCYSLTTPVLIRKDKNGMCKIPTLLTLAHRFLSNQAYGRAITKNQGERVEADKFLKS